MSSRSPTNKAGTGNVTVRHAGARSTTHTGDSSSTAPRHDERPAVAGTIRVILDTDRRTTETESETRTERGAGPARTDPRFRLVRAVVQGFEPWEESPPHTLSRR